MSDIDGVLARYLRALRAAGAPESDPIASAADVESVVNGVAPYLVPRDVQRAWQSLGRRDWLVDVGDFLPPRSALEMISGDEPRLLFPLSYASHTFLFVELGVVAGPSGGALLLAPIAEPLIRYAPSLAWALDFISAKIEAGAVQLDGPSTGEVLERAMREAAAAESWPAYLLATIDPYRPLSWPAHWQRAQGIDPADATPLGANTPIAALRALPPGGSCRIEGKIVALAGAAVGSRVTVSDATGEAIVWVPRSADPFHVVGIRDRVELEITVGQPREEPSEQIFTEIAASTFLADDEHKKRIAAGAMAMFDAASYRFRASFARPVEG